MRKIEKQFDQIPVDLLSDQCKEKVADALIVFGDHKFDSATYGSKGVREELNKLYYNKCAFCETDSSAGATPQVEHYRPKAKVTGTDGLHPGYYWLGYEWSNLLLACPACNNKKRNQFPIAGIRVSTHPLTRLNVLDTTACSVTSPSLISEEPLLVNPEVDANPMRHFKFTKSGELIGLTAEGVKSIEVYNLNRESLIMARKKIVFDAVYEEIVVWLWRFHAGKLTDRLFLIQALQVSILKFYNRLTDVKSQYLAFTKACWDNFDPFLIGIFPSSDDQELLRGAYSQVIDEIQQK